MFITDQQALRAVADMLKYDVDQLPAYWASLTKSAHTTAYQDIEGILIGRGYTLAQISAWDRGPEFEKDLTIFWAMTRGAGSHNFDDRFLRPLDRRSDLKSIQVFTSGVWVPPGVVTPGQVHVGSVERHTAGFGPPGCDDDGYANSHRWG